MLLNISRVSVSQNQLAFPHKSLCFVTSTSRSHWSCFARRVTDSPVETVSCWSTRITSMLPFLPDTVWILFYSYTINIGNLCRVLVCYWPRKPNDQFSHLINWIKIPISVVKKKISRHIIVHVMYMSSYQFLEDAYRNHKQYLENMTQQLQEKRKVIEEVSGYISKG